MTDISELGVHAAELMEHMETEYAGKNGELGVVAVIAEINYVEDDGEEVTCIEYRCSDGRRWVQRGIFHEAYRAVGVSSDIPEED